MHLGPVNGLASGLPYYGYTNNHPSIQVNSLRATFDLDSLGNLSADGFPSLIGSARSTLPGHSLSI